MLLQRVSGPFAKWQRSSLLKQRDSLGYIQRAEEISTCHMSQQREQSLAPAIYYQPSWCERCTARSHSAVLSSVSHQPCCFIVPATDRQSIFTETILKLSVVAKVTIWDRACSVFDAQHNQVRKCRRKKEPESCWKFLHYPSRFVSMVKNASA